MCATCVRAALIDGASVERKATSITATSVISRLAGRMLTSTGNRFDVIRLPSSPVVKEPIRTASS